MPKTEEILKNIWNQLTSDNQTTSDFETWKTNFSGSEEIQGNIYNYLKKNNFTESDFDSWSINVGVKKKDESDFIAQDPNGELVTENISSDIPVYDFEKPQTEQDYFEGTFGDILRSFDAVTQTGLGDFVDDMARSAATGYYQGQVAEDASDILLRGANATDEDIYSYIEANKEAQKLGPSDEMMEYQKTYEENGKGFMGVVMGLYKSGFQVIPEVILSSVFSMATNKDSLSTGAAVVGTGALYGAGTGALAGGVGAVPGAIAGAAATIPYAFAAAGSVLEMGATFSELLQEEIEGELTPEKIREAISNEEIYTKIRNKALARGITIGVIDMFTGRIGGRVAGKILSKAATKGTKIKSVLAASGIESVGGSVGEATARGVIGQEMDISEIALEGIAEAPGGVKDVISARFSKPKYKVNGKKVDAATVDNLIETMNLDQLQATKINIDNDYEGRGKKLSDRVLELNTERLILEANPDINPETLSEITRLQLELSSLEGNKTEVAKEKSSILKSKIKDLQENQLETEVATEADAFNELEQDEQIKYIEQAGKELIQESEARGDEEFEITEQQNLERAVELFNKDQQTETEAVDETSTEIVIEDPSKGYSFEYESEQDIPIELKNVEPNSKSVTEVNGKKKIRLTFSGQKLIDAGLGKLKTDTEVEVTTAPKAEVKAEPEVEVEPEVKEEVDGEVIVGRKGEITLKRNNKTKEDIIETPSGARLIKGIDTNGEVYYEVEGNTDELISLGFNPDNFTFNEENIKKVISDLSKQVDPAPKAEVEASGLVETEVEPKTEQEIKARIKELEQVPSGMNAAMQAAKEGKPTNTPEISAMQEAEISAKEEIESLKEKLKKPRKQVTKVEQQVDNAKKALNKLDKDIKIVIHNDDSSYRKATREDNRGQSTRGEYNPSTKTININATKVQDNTVAHEVFHALLLRNRITNKQAKSITDSMLKAVNKTASPELLQKLKEHSDNYESALQSEESIAELFGILASEYKSLDKPTQNLVQRWINKIAKILGVKKFTDAEVIDLLNVVSAKVEAGQEITEQDVAILDKNKYVKNPAQFLSRKQNGDFEVVYTENEKISQYVKDGRITEPENLEEFRGNKTAITSPDDMVVGEIYFNGDKIFEGQGGLFFVTKFGDVWAAGDKTTATKLADMINRSVEANGGKGYLTLTKGTDKKLISSAAGVNSSLGIIDVLLTQNILPKSVVRTAVKKVITDFGGGNVDLRGTSKQMVSQLREFFGDKKNATFEARGTVMERIITEIGKDKRLGDLKKKNSKLTKILGGDPSKTLVGGKTSKTANSLVDLIASLAAEQITKGLNTGDIYGVIEVDGKVEYYAGTHPSYPAHIRQVNKKPPTLHLPKNRPAAKDYLMRASNKIYKTPAVSPTEYGSFYELEDAPQSRKQKLAPNGKRSNLNDKQYDIVRTPAFKKWFGDWETDPANASKVVDENGEPLVVYHGTNYDFDIFESGKGIGSGDSFGYLGKGHYFTNDYDVAESYSDYNKEPFAVFINSKNPYISSDYRHTQPSSQGSFAKELGVSIGEETKFLKSKNKDGVLSQDKTESDYLEVLVYSSNQIKLADGSNITFDPDAPSIRKQKPGKKPSKKPTRKRTSSIKKAITEIKNVLDITPDEQRKIFTALNDQKKNAKDIKKDIVASLRELTKEGKITPSKMVSVINKVPDDFNNPITVERFVEYMTKVFNDADYGNKMMIANAKKGKARKNASTKLGIAEGLVEQLQRLFSVKPSLIPDSVLDQYMSLINMFGKREAVLSLPSIEEVTQITEDVLQQLDEEHSMAIELADRFDAAEKVMGENGVDYAATIKEMLDNEVITDREYEVMKKYKSEINPPVPATPKTEAEIEAERQETIENIKETKEIDPSVFPSRLERDDAKEFNKLLKTDAVEGLSLDDLKNLFKVIDNINNGYLPHYAKIMISKMTSINDAKVAANAIKKSKLLPLSKIYANLKSKITKKAGTSELVRRNPTFYIDQVFGDFKTQDIFNSIFKRSAEASASYTKDIKEIQVKIEKAEQSVLKSFNRNPNKTQASKYKQMSYLIQQEFLSNPDSNQVNSVEDFLKATIKRINQETTSYTENDAKMLQEILDTYTENGTKTFDNVALYESFNVAERNSIRTLEEINKSLTEAAVYTANIIRGNKITTLKNYTHLSVIPDVAKGDIVETETSMISDMFNKYLKPSTKAKSLIERTGKASPLNFDVYASVQRGSKYTLMDFHLTDPIKTAKRTLNEIEKSLSDKDGNMPTDARRKFNAIRDASVESIENLLSNALTQSTTGDQVIDYIQKQGYRAILAGVPRAAYELTSNVLAGMFMDPKGFVTGIKLRKIIGTPGAKDIMNNLNSTQTNRVFSTGLSGKFVDTGILNQAAGVTASKAKGKVKNTILQLWNNSGQRWIKGVEFTADTLISSPDKLVMQPMWFGSFENRFKQITGTSPDFDKIAANDEAYMDKYSSALKEAKTLADNRSVAMGATDNSFMGVLKGTVKPNQGVSLRVFNSFNGFMTRFLIFEYMTARTGIMAAMGNGQVSKKQGVALLAGVTTRMVAYTFLGSLVAESMKSLTEDDDEDFDFSQAQYEDDDAEGMKSIDKMLGQAMTSAFTSLLFGRDFGNATKSIINYGLEELNENYGQFLRDGEYDKYRDAIQYTLIPEGRSGKSPQFMDVAKNLFAAYTPMLKTLEFGVNKIFEADKVEPDAIERQQDERFVRLPLEALGVAGFIPFYKDIRKIVLSNMYKGLRKAKKEAANKKKRKEEMLQGYSSETDMKRYDFSLWERTFGPDSQGYDTRQAEKELRRKERKLRQLKKDQMYDYTPPSNNRKRKSSSPFGPLSDGDKSSPFGG
tara:strand:- start:64 stop:8589 length:8526 start_codon:yes stop_codon:yes gene_type:complete